MFYAEEFFLDLKIQILREIRKNYMSTKEHYDHHLGDFYEWMVGDFDIKQQEQQAYFEKKLIFPKINKVAIDLGAGHGLHAISLAHLGFEVKAVDFNQQLLNSLSKRKESLPIEVIESDLLTFSQKSIEAELIICMGDTIAHLNDFDDLKALIKNCYQNLTAGGKLIFSYRNYSQELKDTQRFIPVKSDEQMILVCVLDFEENRVRVTDLLYQKIGNQWVQKLSSYHKLRIDPQMITDFLKNQGFSHVETESEQRMYYSIAQK